MDDNGLIAYIQLSDDQFFRMHQGYSSFNPISPTTTWSAEITYDVPTIVPSLTGAFAPNFNTRSTLQYSIGTKMWTSVTVMVTLNGIFETPLLSIIINVGMVPPRRSNVWFQRSGGYHVQNWYLELWLCHASKSFCRSAVLEELWRRWIPTFSNLAIK